MDLGELIANQEELDIKNLVPLMEMLEGRKLTELEIRMLDIQIERDAHIKEVSGRIELYGMRWFQSFIDFINEVFRGY